MPEIGNNMSQSFLDILNIHPHSLAVKHASTVFYTISLNFSVKNNRAKTLKSIPGNNNVPSFNKRITTVCFGWKLLADILSHMFIIWRLSIISTVYYLFCFSHTLKYYLFTSNIQIFVSLFKPHINKTVLSVVYFSILFFLCVLFCNILRPVEQKKSKFFSVIISAKKCTFKILET